MVAADAVVAVDPFLRTLHLAHSPRALPRAGVRAASSAGARAAWAWSAPRLRETSSVTAQYGRELGVWIAAAGAWLRPRVRALGSAAWVAVVGLSCAAAEAGRRVYARFVDHRSAPPPSDNV
jgi:hypothetical protein